MTERPGHARELAKAAVKRGVRLVMAWGGDGTINEVASALAFDEVPLGIIPAGSGNGLARELGVNLRPERAIADALAAEPRPMDVGELDGHLFVNIAGIGLDAHVASRFSTHHRRGLLGYATITAQALATYVPKHVPDHARGEADEASRGPRDDRELRAVRQRRAHRARRESGRRVTGPGGAGRAVPGRDAVSAAALVQRDRRSASGAARSGRSRESRSKPTSR